MSFLRIGYFQLFLILQSPVTKYWKAIQEQRTENMQNNSSNCKNKRNASTPESLCKITEQ